jgi:8-oxo-dGTP diphosphatase
MDIHSLKRIEVVAGLICENGRVLVCQRSANAAFPLKWEFPGGKVEKGERHEDALRRELREELQIEIDSATKIYQYKHSYPGVSEVNLTFFRVQRYRGEIKNLIFQRIDWVELERLREFDFLEGDLPLIRKLASRDDIGAL